MQLQATEKSLDEQNFDKMRAAYEACLDEDKIKERGLEPLLKVLDYIKGLFPDDSTKTGPSATHDAVSILSRYGVSTLVATGTGADDRDPDKVVVSVAAPWSFGLPSKERYEDDKLVEKYRSVAVQVLSAIYPDQERSVFAKVIDFEKKLAAASPSTAEREDVTVSIQYVL